MEVDSDSIKSQGIYYLNFPFKLVSTKEQQSTGPENCIDELRDVDFIEKDLFLYTYNLGNYIKNQGRRRNEVKNDEIKNQVFD